jgi:HD-like signal output (HDOD) protein/ActR/RegA family two-component response regulator
VRHVLFVDDDTAVLAGLRRMLHGKRSQWRASFAGDGAAALVLLAADPADVVVCDMRMPGMDGAQLLREVQARWPQTVRIVLSGYADAGAALRSLPVAHQFVTKPCDAATLCTVVSDACGLVDRLSRPALRTLVAGLGGLPSAPRSFAAITDVLSRPEASVESVAEIITHDTACSAKLLQMVNSAFFALPRRVVSVRDAVAYLGVVPVRTVVLAAETVEMFRCRSSWMAGITESINQHSLAIAELARDRVAGAGAHDAYVAGVLHDVGRLAMAAAAPESFRTVQHRVGQGQHLGEAELDVFGAGHGDVGGFLLRLWGVPFPLIAAVARHADPDAAADADPIVAALASAEAEQAGDGCEAGETGAGCGAPAAPASRSAAGGGEERG